MNNDTHDDETKLPKDTMIWRKDDIRILFFFFLLFECRENATKRKQFGKSRQQKKTLNIQSSDALVMLRN